MMKQAVQINATLKGFRMLLQFQIKFKPAELIRPHFLSFFYHNAKFHRKAEKEVENRSECKTPSNLKRFIIKFVLPLSDKFKLENVQLKEAKETNHEQLHIL